ncbi:hypothetical protein RNJ44_00934 [Nakaseomyces bracarensis]|uniref:Proteasome assembly chaperone 3 n=1 Tax=Nakaseomyces bracarensis TaxID=273131 RepID=A0ABR4NQL9_9SACH
MQVRQLERQLPEEFGHGGVGRSVVSLKAVHYNNAVLLQVRLDGEMDSTYEVSSVGLKSSVGRPLALNNTGAVGGDGSDDEEEAMDYLADYKVVTRLGDSDDPKMNIVCTQIAELYYKLIGADNITATTVVISLSRKLWKGHDSNDRDFAVLVFLLQCIKDMYVSQ